MEWVYDDGGRKAAGYKGDTGDCSTRAITIATGRPYQEIYDLANRYSKEDWGNRSTRKRNADDRVNARQAARGRRRRITPGSARTGMPIDTVRRLLTDLDWQWVPTMQIGAGCKVHLRADELPAGRLVVRVSKHLCAVVDHVVRDLHDPSREGTRCVYGYWQPSQYAAAAAEEVER